MNAAICANPACDRVIDLAKQHVTISRNVEVEVDGTVIVTQSEVLHHHLSCFERQIGQAPRPVRVSGGLGGGWWPSAAPATHGQSLPSSTNSSQERTS